MLTRYWITFDAADSEAIVRHSLGLGVGVTAFDEQDALKHVTKALGCDELPRMSSITPHVRVEDLEEDHVQRNLGNPAVRGVWYPSYNLR